MQSRHSLPKHPKHASLKIDEKIQAPRYNCPRKKQKRVNVQNVSLKRLSVRPLLGYAACAGAAVLWGTGFFWGKLALQQMSVAHMVLYRFLFASVGMLPVLWVVQPKFSAKTWRLLFLASFLGVPLQFLCQFKGLSLTTVSHASLMVGVMPVILAAGASLFMGERLDLSGWLALGVSGIGVSLIILGTTPTHSGSGPTLAGDMLIILSMFIALGWLLINKGLMATYSPLVVSAYGVLLGTGMLVPWVLAVAGLPPVQGISLTAWAALIASGLLCSASSTLLWNWGMHRVPASRAGVFLNVEPALGSVLGVKLMGDHLGQSAWFGGALILLAATALTAREGESGAVVELEAEHL